MVRRAALNKITAWHWVPKPPLSFTVVHTAHNVALLNVSKPASHITRTDCSTEQSRMITYVAPQLKIPPEAKDRVHRIQRRDNRLCLTIVSGSSPYLFCSRRYGSAALRATADVCGKGQIIFSSRRSKGRWIDRQKFGTVDYVRQTTHQTKFGHKASTAASGQMDKRLVIDWSPPTSNSFFQILRKLIDCFFA